MKHDAPCPPSQRGAALVVVLILVILVTILGLASLRGALMEERMSANMFDRSLAFQAAESALRVAEQQVRDASASGLSIGFDCSGVNTICDAKPPNVNAANPSGCKAYAAGCWIDVVSPAAYSSKVAGTPQYYIEFMGDFPISAEDADNADRAASSSQYGTPPPTYGKSIYRISARSHDPGTVSGRAVVALQATLELR